LLDHVGELRSVTPRHLDADGSQPEFPIKLQAGISDHRIRAIALFAMSLTKASARLRAVEANRAVASAGGRRKTDDAIRMLADQQADIAANDPSATLVRNMQ